MGQYHYLCNLDTKEYLNPYMFDEGLKQREFSHGQDSILFALSYLLSFKGNPRGGGDFEKGKYKGKWHGNRISMIGDYAKDTDNPTFKENTDGPRNNKNWKNISIDVLTDIIRTNYDIAESFYERLKNNEWYLSRYPNLRKRVNIALSSQGFGEKIVLNRDKFGRFVSKI